MCGAEKITEGAGDDRLLPDCPRVGPPMETQMQVGPVGIARGAPRNE